MNFVEKKTIHDRLLGVTHMDADRELLGRLVPGHKLVSKRTFNPQSDASSLLWALLDYANEDDIVKHRREVAAKRISVSKESSEELPDASESEDESAESSNSDAAETSDTSPVAADNSMAALPDNIPVSDSALDNEAEVSCVDDPKNEDDIVKHRREVAAKRISVSKESSEELPDASESEDESAESSNSDAAETSDTSPVAADNSMAALPDNIPVSDSALDNEAEVSCVDDPKNEVQSQQDLSKVADKKKSQKSSNTPK